MKSTSIETHFYHMVNNHLITKQAEAQKAATSAFRRNLLMRLQQEFTAREETRNRSVQEWVCLVTFICSIFDYIKVKDLTHKFFFFSFFSLPQGFRLAYMMFYFQVNNAPLVALVDPIYDCLFRLAQPDALMNEEEVRCISAHEYLKVNFTLGRFF